MKKILIVLFGFSFTFTNFAQQDINTTFKTQMTTRFAPLDKTKVPHGILLNFGMEFTNVPAFNGVLTDSTFSNKVSLTQIYNTLLSSRIRSVPTGFVTPTEFETRWNNNRIAGIVSLAGLYFKYAQFIPNASIANKLTVLNDVYYDKYVGGIWQNPYQEYQTFAIAPAIKLYEGLKMKVKIPSNTFYSNYQSQVQTIKIDFGNGLGYVPMLFDQIKNVNYTTVGVKIWKYKLTLTNGTIMYNQSRIKLKNGISTIPYPENGGSILLNSNPVTNAAAPIQPPIVNQKYDKNITATKIFDGAYGSVKLTIDTNGDGIINKPLIVAEGFDIGVILSPENPNGIYNYDNFRDFLFGGGANLRNLIYNSNKQYDIIYVDWANGLDFMQRNAFALETAIAWVNQQKANAGSTEKNVVLGQSMGGVIARYALADLEQNGLVHDTRLFKSHDAPQQGANIPISAQYLYRNINRQYISSLPLVVTGEVFIPVFTGNQQVSNYLSLLDAPASKQLLANWSNINYEIDNTQHTNFYNELKNKGINPLVNKGYPINCKNISISNGSECGNGQNFNPGDPLLNFQWNKGLNFVEDLLSIVVIPFGGAIGTLVDVDFWGVVGLGLIPGNSRFNVDFQAKSIPYGSNNLIYKAEVSYSKKILWIGPRISIYIIDVEKNQPPGVLPFDSYGGGFFNTSQITSVVNISGLYIRDRFGFIPTSSALDVGKRDVQLTDIDYKSRYVGANPLTGNRSTPFANFTTSFDINPNVSNKQHISFDTRTGDWLANELNIVLPQATTNCSFICDNVVQITGANSMCTNGETYSVNLPSFLTPAWSISQGSNLVTLINNSNGTVTLTSDNYSGTITLSVSFGNGTCGTKTITKTISIGNNIYNYSLTPIDAYCESPFHYFVLQTSSNIPDQINGISNFYPSVGIFTSGLNGTNNVVLRTPYNYTGGAGFEVLATNNSCGKFKYTFSIGGIQDCQFIQPARIANTNINFYKIYPNPATNIVNIDLKNQEQKPSQNSTIVTELYNMMGELKRNVSIVNNIASIDVLGLQRGIYLLRINIDGVVESHQVGIE